MRQISFGEKSSALLEKILLPLRVRQIVKNNRSIDKIKAVADIGTGYRATFLFQLIEKYPNIELAVGVDLSVEKKLENEKIKLVVADLNKNLPIEDCLFDAVFSTAVIEHLDNYTLALKEMHRILKPGGSIFITTPSPRAKPILEFLAFRLSLLDKLEIGDHKNYFSGKGLKVILQETGFDNVRVKSFQFGLNNIATGKKST